LPKIGTTPRGLNTSMSTFPPPPPIFGPLLTLELFLGSCGP
jgi:hypothetical protein